MKVLFYVFVTCLLNVPVRLKCQADTVNIVTPKRLELTREYSLVHYGINDYHLINPEIIVVHYTVYPTLEEVTKKLRPDELPSNRGDISSYSSLNVSAHYVVDRDGTVYNFLPDTVMARHVIGFNHTSIGIENIAKNKDDLTPEQLKSNARLIDSLVKEHESLKYLIGHHEYMIKDYPHFVLFLEKDKNYKPSVKIDPGDKFMTGLRAVLKEKYNIELLK